MTPTEPERHVETEEDDELRLANHMEKRAEIEAGLHEVNGPPGSEPPAVYDTAGAEDVAP